MPKIKLNVVEPSPPGMRVPDGGSCCFNCMYLADTGRNCVSPIYIKVTYKGKREGDDRFVDGKTGKIVKDPNEFCCNAYDWQEQ